MTRGARHTLIYDGDCRMCSRLTDALRRWDAQGNIEIVSFQTPGVMTRFPWIPERAFAEAMQLVGPGGETWQGSAAVEELLSILPRGRWIAWIYHVPFVRALAERVYRWIARNRHRLGCGEHCARPIRATRFRS